MTLAPSPDFRARLGVLAITLLPTLLIVGGVGLAVVRNPEWMDGLRDAWGVLMAGDPDGLRRWILQFGAWAPVVSGLLQIAAAIFPPGPSFVIAIANAMVFGFVWGGLLTLGTQIVAGLTCFGLARVIGRPGVARIVGGAKLGRMDDFMARRGVAAVFIGRIVPFINPDLVSYVAGLSAMSIPRFSVALGAGALPSVLFYSFIGASALDLAPRVLWIVGIASTLPLLVVFWFWRRRGDGLRGMG
jgi:uncharacterized membrane protein YdjX (TVP38/TMEM64 family)